MKISGFTIIRNGVSFDYPFLESLRSLLPLVDELVINVGFGTDDTIKKIQNFAKDEGQNKVVIFESHWPLDDPEKRKGGQILSEQTNLALDRCTGDWCIYLQADEVFHEDDTSKIKNSIQEANRDSRIHGVLFQYRHFYGSFDIVQDSRNAYRREVRAIRKSSGARSVGDAQSFRLPGGEKLDVLMSQARVFHYGWVRQPDAMKEKTRFMDGLYHGLGSENSEQPKTGDNYLYKRIWGLKRFSGTHPQVMTHRIKEKNWRWDFEHSPRAFSWRDLKKIPLDLFERISGVRLFEYKSYKCLK